MVPAIHTDVDLDWWVPFLGVGLFLVFAPRAAFYVFVIDLKVDAASGAVDVTIGRP